MIMRKGRSLFTLQKNFSSIINQETTAKFRGSLLAGDDFTQFNPHLDCQQAYQTMNDKSTFWEAVQADSSLKDLSIDEYLSKCGNSSIEFLNSGKIWNREEVQTQIQRISTSRGGIAFVTGGESTGKSLLLRNFAKQNATGTVIYLDARITGTNIEQALLSELNTNHPVLFDKCVRSVFPSTALPMLPGDKQSQFLHQMKAQNMMLPNLFRQLSMTSPPCTLIFDDADLYFSLENRHNLQNILQVLIEMSSRSRQLNVILASSDYNFPYNFPSLRINLSDHIVISDLAPVEMHSLLMKWEVGPHLATTLMNHFGGHILSISSAIESLRRIKQNYHSAITYEAANHGVQMCLSRALSTLPLQENLYSSLKSLAEDGYIELKQNDPLAEHLSKNKVAGFVPYDSISSPVSQFHYNRRVLIPTLQMIRMVIAATLLEG